MVFGGVEDSGSARSLADMGYHGLERWAHFLGVICKEVIGCFSMLESLLCIVLWAGVSIIKTGVGLYNFKVKFMKFEQEFVFGMV